MTGSPTDRSLGLNMAAALMIVFGLAEVATGFTHEFFGLSTSAGAASTILGAAIGAVYALAGLLVLVGRAWAWAASLVCLAAVIVGRIALVVTGLFPVDSIRQAFAIIAGTSIAAAFAIYIARKRQAFIKQRKL